MNKAQQGIIEQLWDGLVAFDATQTEDAMRHVLGGLAEILGAARAFWLGSVRLSRNQSNDPIQGWRPAAIFYLERWPGQDEVFKDHCRRINQGRVDPSIVANLRQSGQFRVTRQHELVPPDWYDSEFYQTFFAPLGIQDALYVVMPLGPDVESWFGFQRVGHTEPLFDDEACAIAETAVRPLKWLHRRIALFYGLNVAEKPLTATEQRVLNALLGNETEQAIADRLAMAQSSVHTYCTRICRKFNVRGRTGLLALWLGRSAEP